MVTVDVSLWLAEMLSFNHTSLTKKERLLKEIQTLRLQQDISVWLVCLNLLLSLFVCVVTVTTM